MKKNDVFENIYLNILTYCLKHEISFEEFCLRLRIKYIKDLEGIKYDR